MPLPIPTSLAEARQVLGRMRRGLVTLMARFEADRYASIEALMETFGARETLAGLQIHEPRVNIVRLLPPIAGSHVVH